MEHSFTDATFQILRGFLTDTELTEFDSFFRTDENTGNHVCYRYDDYLTWLVNIGEDPNYSQFTAWDGFVNGKSQGSDVKP